MLDTTVGQLLVNDVLPAHMRDYSRTLNKKAVKKLLTQVAKEAPDQFPAVIKNLSQLSNTLATRVGGYSYSTDELVIPEITKKAREKFKEEINKIYADDSLTREEKDKKLVQYAVEKGAAFRKELMDWGLKNNYLPALMINSGAKGNDFSLSAAVGMDFLYQGEGGAPVAYPVLHNHAEGLEPMEYWAASFGARQGVIGPKLGTADAGFLSKQLIQIAHKSVIVGDDSEETPKYVSGLPSKTDDNDNIGRLLAHDVGGYKRNTVITDRVLHDLQTKGIEDILVRSPIVGGPFDGGLYSRDVGITDKNRLPVMGENPGVTAVQAMSEPLSQGALAIKHTGGVVGSTRGALTGFDTINQLIQVPKTYKNGAAHAQLDGYVRAVEKGPSGGTFVTINDKRHFVPYGQKILVQPGQEVEAGDLLSEGLPNPSEFVKHKGVGEGRRAFVETCYDVLKNAGISQNKRNVEMLAQGLINHVRLKSDYGDWIVDDVVPYRQLEAAYTPREGARKDAPHHLKGYYLEQPVLHYTVGTRIKPSVIRQLEKFGVNEVVAHKDDPVFEPEMIRGMGLVAEDPDWTVRMYGAGQKRSLQEAVVRGRRTNPYGTSAVAAIVHNADPNLTENGKPVAKVTSPLNYLPKQNYVKPDTTPENPEYFSAYSALKHE